MRGLRLLIVVLVVLFASTFADNSEHRSLRIAVEDNTEERVFREFAKGLKTSANGKYQSTKTSLKKLKAKYQAIKARIKKDWNDAKMDRNDAKIITAIKNGESQDSILARMGVKPSHVDPKTGTKFYDTQDPGWQEFNMLYRAANPEKTQ